ncbi:MAG: hypothetical protein EOP00_16860 [Pedobacter sp.]|nr:MAG: hypothetical protein EOP00_16860 [Pedobacter sp.]
MDINQQKVEWLMRLQHIFQAKNIVELKDDLYEKLDLLIYLHEILAEQKTSLKDNEQFLESLIVKFYLHGLTIHQITSGYKANSKYLNPEKISNFTFIDIPSLLTVGRAQLESLLMYQHLYVNTLDYDEQILRYHTWIYTALIQRLNMPRRENFDDFKLEETKREIAEIKIKITSCPAYNKLSDKQKIGLLEKGTAKSFRTWDQIFKDSNFNKNGTVEKFYYLQSAYAHSEGLAGLQLKHNKYSISSEANQQWIWLQVLTSWFFTATMIENLVARFPPIEKEYLKVDDKIKFEIGFLNRVLKNNEPIA